MLGHAGDIEIVGEAATAAQALARIRAVRPDVVVLDVRLPDGDGPSVCRELRTTLVPAPAFLFFTSYTDHAALFAAVDAGAAGFLLKEVNRLGLVEAVRRVAAGGVDARPAADARGARAGCGTAAPSPGKSCPTPAPSTRGRAR